MTRSVKRWIGAATAAVFVAAALPAITSAEESDTIYACVKTQGGQVRFVSAASECLVSETAVPLNQAGAEGPQGAEGPEGPDGPQGPPGPSGANFVSINRGDLRSVEIAGLGVVELACGPSLILVEAEFAIMRFSPTIDEVTSVWTEDSGGTSSFNKVAGNEAITNLARGIGTRHVVVRAMNSTKSGTWDIFLHGSGANGCLASVQHTP